ncbi:MAG: ATP-dependent sacrificial sulfur transferase LarE [Tissierellaceae bacterium]
MIYKKYEELKNRLRDLGSVAIAFSGGVDSTFLLYVAKEVLKDRVIAITVNAPMYTEREKMDAKYLASKLDVEHINLKVDEGEIEGLIENKPDRCYHCKKAIFTNIREVAKSKNIEYVVDGTNADDIDDYRPGMKALKELGIVSPLREVGLNKEEIRILSKELDIPTWDKPSMACLASRIPYGTNINHENLKMVERCEDYLLKQGYGGFRVRYHGNLARIELDPKDIERFISSPDIKHTIDYFKEVGFIYVTLDLEGYKVGSMNHVLTETEKFVY